MRPVRQNPGDDDAAYPPRRSSRLDVEGRKYIIPLKVTGILDANVVDEIFYRVPELSRRRAGGVLLFLRGEFQPLGKSLESALQQKSSLQRFVEQIQRENRRRLPLKSLIIKPVQRIPRYELLLKRLLSTLRRRTRTGAAQAGGDGAGLSQREYLRHDVVQVEGRKESVCPVLQRPGLHRFEPKVQSLAATGPGGHRDQQGPPPVAVRSPLEEVERLEEDRSLVLEILDLSTKLLHQALDGWIAVSKQQQQQAAAAAAKGEPGGPCRIDLLTTSPARGIASYALIFGSPEKKAQWENSFLDTKMKLLYKGAQIPDFLQTLQITKIRSGMQFTCGSAIEGYNESHFRDVWICKSDGYISHLCLLSLQPEPMVSLNIPLSAATPGQLRLLRASLRWTAEEVPQGLLRQGSEHRRRSRVHAVTERSPRRRRPPMRSARRRSPRGPLRRRRPRGESSKAEPEATPPPLVEQPLAASAATQATTTRADPDADESSSPEAFGKASSTQSQPATGASESAASPAGLAASPSVKSKKLSDPYKGTMWLGCEDGWIYVYYCTDNVRTTRSRQKIKQKAGVTSIIHLDGRVYACLQNGEIAVYRRKPGGALAAAALAAGLIPEDGLWDFENHRTILVKEKKPLKQLVAVAGKVWCGSQKDITVVNPVSESSESTFTVGHQSGRRSVQAMVCSGYAVWIALENSTKVFLYHALSA
uniref:DH domain-containing protein n=1 Tax=Macrostomum lignano TaxID=282301 RepID=A0A1I8F7G1_9PLAT